MITPKLKTDVSSTQHEREGLGAIFWLLLVGLLGAGAKNGEPPPPPGMVNLSDVTCELNQWEALDNQAVSLNLTAQGEYFGTASFIQLKMTSPEPELAGLVARSQAVLLPDFPGPLTSPWGPLVTGTFTWPAGTFSPGPVALFGEVIQTDGAGGELATLASCLLAFIVTGQDIGPPTVTNADCVFSSLQAPADSAVSLDLTVTGEYCGPAGFLQVRLSSPEPLLAGLVTRSQEIVVSEFPCLQGSATWGPLITGSFSWPAGTFPPGPVALFGEVIQTDGAGGELATLATCLVAFTVTDPGAPPPPSDVELTNTECVFSSLEAQAGVAVIPGVTLTVQGDYTGPEFWLQIRLGGSDPVFGTIEGQSMEVLLPAASSPTPFGPITSGGLAWEADTFPVAGSFELLGRAVETDGELNVIAEIATCQATFTITPPAAVGEFKDVAFEFSTLSVPEDGPGNVMVTIGGEYRGPATFIQAGISSPALEDLEGFGLVTAVPAATGFEAFVIQSSALEWPALQFAGGETLLLIGRLIETSNLGTEIQTVAIETGVLTIIPAAPICGEAGVLQSLSAPCGIEDPGTRWAATPEPEIITASLDCTLLNGIVITPGFGGLAEVFWRVQNIGQVTGDIEISVFANVFGLIIRQTDPQSRRTLAPGETAILSGNFNFPSGWYATLIGKAFELDGTNCDNVFQLELTVVPFDLFTEATAPLTAALAAPAVFVDGAVRSGKRGQVPVQSGQRGQLGPLFGLRGIT